MLSLIYNRCHHLSCSAIVAELTEIDALPCAEIQSPVSNGDVDAHAPDDALRMGGHIVRSFKDVLVVRHVLRHKPVVNRLHVSPHISVPVLAIAFFRRDSAKLKQAWLCPRCFVSYHTQQEPSPWSAAARQRCSTAMPRSMSPWFLLSSVRTQASFMLLKQITNIGTLTNHEL